MSRLPYLCLPALLLLAVVLYAAPATAAPPFVGYWDVVVQFNSPGLGPTDLGVPDCWQLRGNGAIRPLPGFSPMPASSGGIALQEPRADGWKDRAQFVYRIDAPPDLLALGLPVVLKMRGNLLFEAIVGQQVIAGVWNGKFRPLGDPATRTVGTVFAKRVGSGQPCGLGILP